MKEKIIMIIMAVALMALPAMAQQQQWKSTSTMQGTGSYVAPVTAVGATSVAPTYTPAKAPGGPRRLGEDYNDDDWGVNREVEDNVDPDSPIGDAVLPLLLMALAFAGVVYYRRRAKA